MSIIINIIITIITLCISQYSTFYIMTKRVEKDRQEKIREDRIENINDICFNLSLAKQEMFQLKNKLLNLDRNIYFYNKKLNKNIDEMLSISKKLPKIISDINEISNDTIKPINHIQFAYDKLKYTHIDLPFVINDNIRSCIFELYEINDINHVIDKSLYSIIYNYENNQFFNTSYISNISYIEKQCDEIISFISKNN
ncbi:hypothetical protein MOO46_05175 [Apilactobacillus apisilvae]|uniref:Uncharacterized protein n=1 Tax=Apilactobacillus apisilvae TaxID=2923364 RepID=A0ABY4PGY9_9LACO|nr:hypothetical protein [Apilactobacillus apisilvae]UQS84642.1 hypothetical protein MOO46_05175 [Apilactobacillus apisilvae]